MERPAGELEYHRFVACDLKLQATDEPLKQRVTEVNRMLASLIQMLAAECSN
jgi:hypothetical protein